MSDVVIHGWSFSPFLRAVRIALIEKGVAHRVREMTPADTGTPEFRAKNPFAKIPVLEHDGLMVRETVAILHYVEAAFAGPALLPAQAALRARTETLMLAAASYLYPTGVMGVFFQHAYVLENGGTPDAAKVAAAATTTAPVLDALEHEVSLPWCVGEAFSLADAMLVPMLQNLAMTPAGQGLLASRPRLAAILSAGSARPSVAATQAPIPRFGLAA